MLGAESVSMLKEVVSVAHSICAKLDTSSNAYSSTVTPSHYRIDFDNYHLPRLQPLTSRLVEEGVPCSLAEKISNSYLRTAEGLKSQTEAIFRETCCKLLAVPHSDLISLTKLYDRIFDIQSRNYLSTLSQWEEEAIDIATSRLAARTEPVTVEDNTQQGISSSEPQSCSSTKKSRRPFKSEFLPLLEFAFSKDHFPSREDKKHLARISNMSYRQVSVWFQNRRCRTAKTNSTSAPSRSPPQTLEEVKKRLSVSAKAPLDGWGRRASSSSGPGVTRESTMEPVSMTGTEYVAESLRAPSPLPQPVLAFEGIAESSEALSTLDVGYDSEELFEDKLCEGTKGREAMSVLEGTFPSPDPAMIPLPESPTLSPSPGPASISSYLYTPPSPCAPSRVLNSSPKPPTHIFPASYAPSTVTFNPFVVEHTPWLRHPAERRARTIDATPEVMEGILRSVGGMMEADVTVMSVPLEEQKLQRPKKALPRRRERLGTGDAGLSLSMTENPTSEAGLEFGPRPRTFSGSSGLSSSASSECAVSDESSAYCASAPSSRSSSYSSAFSSCSTFSTPQLSETDLSAVDDDAMDGSGHSMTGSLGMSGMSAASEGALGVVSTAAETCTAWEQLIYAASNAEVACL